MPIGKHQPLLYLQVYLDLKSHDHNSKKLTKTDWLWSSLRCQRRGQSAKIVTYILGNLLNLAVILTNCSILKLATSLKEKNLLPPGALTSVNIKQQQVTTSMDIGEFPPVVLHKLCLYMNEGTNDTIHVDR